MGIVLDTGTELHSSKLFLCCCNYFYFNLRTNYGRGTAMKSLGKTFLYAILVVLFLSVSSYAVPVTVTFEGVSSSQTAIRNNAYAGLYNLAVDGEFVLGMCDDYVAHVDTSNDGWQAERYTYMDIINGDGRWGLPVSDYNIIGYLFEQTFDVTDNQLLADINQAIWYVHSQSLILTQRAHSLYEEALAYSEYTGWHGYMDFLTPATVNGQPVSQEFLIRGSGAAPVPEPATILLFGSGLLGLAGLGRRKSKR